MRGTSLRTRLVVAVTIVFVLVAVPAGLLVQRELADALESQVDDRLGEIDERRNDLYSFVLRETDPRLAPAASGTAPGGAAHGASPPAPGEAPQDALSHSGVRVPRDHAVPPAPFVEDRSAPALPPGSWMGVVTAGGGVNQELVLQTLGTSRVSNIRSSERPEISRALYANADGRVISGTSADGSTRFRLTATAVTPPPRENRLVVAIPLTDSADTVREVRRPLLAIGLGGVALAVVLTAALVTVTLRPLRRIVRAADSVAADDTDVHIPGRDGPAEVRALASSLDSMVGRLADDIAQRQETEERLRRFVADASHELRTPLTSIGGWAQLVRDRDEQLTGDVRARALTGIVEESRHLAELVDAMLALERGDHGRTLEARPVAVADLFRAAADAAMVVAGGEYRVEVDVALDPAATVVADAVATRQVLDNLLANTRRHTPPGTTTILRVVPLEPDPGGHRVVGLESVDDGPRIPDDVLDHAFDRFWRADAARGRDSGGSGLGLAIVRSLVEAQGGRVGLARGTDERGLCVRIVLPREG